MEFTKGWDNQRCVEEIAKSMRMRPASVSLLVGGTMILGNAATAAIEHIINGATVHVITRNAGGSQKCAYMGTTAVNIEWVAGNMVQDVLDAITDRYGVKARHLTLAADGRLVQNDEEAEVLRDATQLEIMWLRAVALMRTDNVNKSSRCSRQILTRLGRPAKP